MNNKILVKLTVPEVDESFDVFIPINEFVWKVKMLLLKSVNDIVSGDMDSNKEYVLLNKNSSKIYTNNEVIIDTDIRNGTELLLIKSN